MDFSNFWWQAAEAPARTGNNSLRFRDAQFLQRTNTGGQSTSETFSFWVKLGDLNKFNGIISRSIQPGVTELYVGHKDGELQKYNGFNNVGTNSGHKHRDPAAWYHYVVAIDDTGTTQYINGIETGSNNDGLPYLLITMH